ncbi:hypothetical protein [Sediminibacterium sp.]|uniref:hypothetical protein n=1 Tax=Sediminibacterium sp. TaxID=1917865 RepID=UPI003F696BB0
MKSFTNLEQAWQQQSGKGAQRPMPEQLMLLSEEQAKQVKAKFRWTIGLLSLTVYILITYFATYAGFSFTTFSIGLLLMIGSLAIRIVLEWISTLQFQQLDRLVDFSTFLQQSTAFYSKRRILHLVITPLLYATYIIGFVLLLPVFKQEFSNGVYLYFVFSGFGSLGVLAWFIYKANRKELAVLKKLQREAL